MPARTRGVLLPGLAGNPPFRTQHQKRVSNLIKTMETSSNEAVKYIAVRASQNSVGTLGKNRIYLRNFADLESDGCEADIDLDARVVQISELLCVRDGLDHQHILDHDEVGEILEYMCTY